MSRFYHVLLVSLVISLALLCAIQASAEEVKRYIHEEVGFSKSHKISLSLDKPTGWTLTREETTLLFEPRENPDEVGVLIIMAHEEDDDVFDYLNAPKELEKFLAAVFQEPTFDKREPVTLLINNKTEFTEIRSYKGLFQDGGKVRFYALLIKVEDVNFLFIGGCLAKTWKHNKVLLHSIIENVAFASEKKK